MNLYAHLYMQQRKLLCILFHLFFTVLYLLCTLLHYVQFPAFLSLIKVQLVAEGEGFGIASAGFYTLVTFPMYQATESKH